MATIALDELLALPSEERARIALALIRSLDSDESAPLDDVWDAELDRRAAEAATASSTISLDDYRAHIRARRTARSR